MRFIFVVFLSFFLTFSLSHAQKPQGKPPAIGKIYGRILDSKTKQPVEFASVTATSLKNDSIITGSLVKQNGDFSLEKLPLIPLKIKISFLGYTTLEQTIPLNMQNMEVDMGNLKLEPDTKVLNEVVIGEEKSTMTMSIDRKVYNVDKDISAKGGTAADVMKNIPSVSVDADGNATLRNSGTQVYVDGRPTTLTLDQIPADQIDKVEVITNASVKFDASTSGGILNIVMKQNRKPGYNGTVSAGVGTNQRYNGSANINIRQNPINFSASYSFNSSRNYNEGYTYRTNLYNQTPTSYFNQDNVNDEQGVNHMARLGLDINLNNRNLLTLAGNFYYRLNDSNDEQVFSSSNSENVITESGSRNNVQINNHYNLSGSAFFKHTFPKKGKELTIDASYNYSNSERDYLFTTYTYDSLQTLLPQNPVIQRNDGGSISNQYIFQLDYVNPLTENSKLEAGIRSYYKPYQSENFTENYVFPTDSYEKDTILSNNYYIDDLINAAYINYMGKMWWSIKYQVGFRFEQSYYKGTIKDRDLEFSYSYPSSASNILNSIFPGIYFTKEVAKNQEMQLNFSRKLNRPNFFQLNPFIMGADNKNYRIGNPLLTPEFTNMGELNYNAWNDKFNLLTSLYFKLNENPITNYAAPSEADSTVLVNTFVNGKNSFFYGIDNALKLTLIKPLDITLSGNITYVALTSSDGLTKNSGFNWDVRTNITYRLPADFTLQANGRYEAPRIILQGSQIPQYSVDFSINKSIKKKWNFSLALNDAFNTRRWGVNYNTPFYIQESSRRRETRFLRFNVSWNFGEQDASLFKKRNQKRPGGESQEMDF
jgi:outer membrane receptor protein involved in Fe transport